MCRDDNIKNKIIKNGSVVHISKKILIGNENTNEIVWSQGAFFRSRMEIGSQRKFNVPFTKTLDKEIISLT
mgnify:CR=1 FL=1